MRHRLIPIEERRLMHREYYMRAVIVFICVLAASVALGAVALFPADIRARVADRAALLAVATAKNNKHPDLEQAEKDLSRASELLTVLDSNAVQTRFSGIVRSIVEIRSPVLLSSFSVDREGTTTISVTLQGIAPTRDSLLAFKGRLEALGSGSTVDLPISTLAKNTNVPFTLKLTQRLR